MMNNRKRRHGRRLLISASLVSACLGMLLLLPGCAYLQRTVETPTIMLDRIELESLSFTRQRFRVTLEVINPNDFRLPIELIRYDLTLQDVPLTRGVFDEGVNLPPGGTELVGISVETDLMSTGRGLLQWLQDPGEAITYRIHGHVLPGMPWAREMPYSHSGRVPLD